MKYLVILGDGMADLPREEWDNRTPLQKANKPNMDLLAKSSEMGLVKTVPDTLSPGSDVANLSALGYDPLKYYTGRSPLEAASIGVTLTDTDVTFRANLVTLSNEENYEDKTMVDYGSDEITTAEAAQLIADLKPLIDDELFTLYSGISYRHLLLWDNGPVGAKLTPPHDISGRKVTDYLPDNEALLRIMKKSNEFLPSHPINQDRVKRGLHPATSLWIWGEGKKPALPAFYDEYQLKGSMISAVDLLKGIGKLADMSVIEVPGATGNIDTNFEGKAQAVIDEFKRGQDFVYVHMEAPDECGHRGEADNKVRAIELIDEKVVGPVLEALKAAGEPFSILLMPDHPTPIVTKTHSREPVPYLIYRSNDAVNGPSCYCEEEAKAQNRMIPDGVTLMQRFLKRA
ncbi:MAG: cofactor-independent phosphoglycerate mutase [Clostridia bacterium]|nr:cofactor-independent phosphoglycerate mutase [Clostridia bacterium]